MNKEREKLIFDIFYDITKLRGEKTCKYEINVNIENKQISIFEIKTIKKEI